MDQLRTLEFVQLQAFARVLQQQNKKYIDFFFFFICVLLKNIRIEDLNQQLINYDNKLNEYHLLNYLLNQLK